MLSTLKQPQNVHISVAPSKFKMFFQKTPFLGSFLGQNGPYFNAEYSKKA